MAAFLFPCRQLSERAFLLCTGCSYQCSCCCFFCFGIIRCFGITLGILSCGAGIRRCGMGATWRRSGTRQGMLSGDSRYTCPRAVLCEYFALGKWMPVSGMSRPDVSFFSNSRAPSACFFLRNSGTLTACALFALISSAMTGSFSVSWATATVPKSRTGNTRIFFMHSNLYPY